MTHSKSHLRNRRKNQSASSGGWDGRVKTSQSEKRFRGLADSMPQLVWTADPDGRLDYCNKRYHEFGGLSRQPDGIFKWESAVHADDRAPTVQAWGQALETGATFQIVHRLLRADQTYRWHLSRAVAVRDDQGAIIKWHGTATDIDDQKRTEEALRVSEERFRTFADATFEGIVVSVEGRIVDCNQQFARMLGYPHTRIPGMRVEQLIAPEFREQVSQALHSGREAIYEHYMLRRDGSRIMVEVHGRTIEYHGRVVRYTIVRDITARKQAEAGLNRYQLLYTHTRDIIFFVRADDRHILEANAAAVKEYGYSREQLLTKSIDDLRADDDRELIGRQMAQADSNGILFEAVHRRKDGSLFTAEISSQGATIEGARTLISVIRDITDRKRAEEQIRASLREKEILLQEIHHRVKNNMQVIKSLLNLQAAMIRDDRLKEQFNESSSRVNAMAIVHETLYQSDSFSQIDLQNYIGRLASGLFAMYSASAKGIRLDIRVQQVFLSMDEAVPCGLVINELICNSLKYAFPDNKPGQITIEAQGRGQEEIELIVSDNGVGLPKDIDLDKISSLGLTLVRGLIESQLGGSIEIDRQQGTRFLIRFPREPDRQSFLR